MKTAFVNVRRALAPSLKDMIARIVTPMMVISGRLKFVSPLPCRFTGAYDSFDQAQTAALRHAVAGYDNDVVADVAFEQMCKLAPWDYPVLFWLNKLGPQIRSLVDAGGHMGTKYRAFRNHLELGPDMRWIVYDVAAIVRAGRLRAQRDNCPGLEFVEDIALAPDVELFLGSGLLQYLDQPLSHLLLSMKVLPRHLILNKVALRKGAEVVTLEKIGPAFVPYRIRNDRAMIRDIEKLGYRLVDRWSIPSLSNVIDTHPELGASESVGFYFHRDD